MHEPSRTPQLGRPRSSRGPSRRPVSSTDRDSAANPGAEAHRQVLALPAPAGAGLLAVSGGSVGACGTARKPLAALGLRPQGSALRVRSARWLAPFDRLVSQQTIPPHRGATKEDQQ